jgi:hypothetical protein
VIKDEDGTLGRFITKLRISRGGKAVKETFLWRSVQPLSLVSIAENPGFSRGNPLFTEVVI